MANMDSKPQKINPMLVPVCYFLMLAVTYYQGRHVREIEPISYWLGSFILVLYNSLSRIVQKIENSWLLIVADFTLIFLPTVLIVISFAKEKELLVFLTAGFLISLNTVRSNWMNRKRRAGV